MEYVLACIDASAFTDSVCDLASWASKRLKMPVELLHVVQRKNAVAERHDLSGAIGLGVKSNLLEELTRLEETDSRLQIESGRVLLAAAQDRLRKAGVAEIRVLHRHGGIVETILEQEVSARVIVIGKRGASHQYAPDHIGSNIERVVRASSKPVIIASREVAEPRTVIFAFDGSPAAKRALERLVNSPLFVDLPVHIVMADTDNEAHRQSLAEAEKQLGAKHAVTSTLLRGKPEAVIADVVAKTPGAVLVMGAYGHSPLRTLIVGSTTTSMIRTVHVPIILVR